MKSSPSGIPRWIICPGADESAHAHPRRRGRGKSGWRLRLEKPKFLVGQDRVVGVIINNEARAYSLAEALSQCRSGQ